MDKREVETRVHAALSTLINADLHLLEVNASERAIAHRLALYLEGRFEDLAVDCEYNRVGLDPKSILSERFWALRGRAGVDLDKRSHVYPDIVVHERGSDTRNLLAIEIKKVASQASTVNEIDDEKLRLYVVPSGLGYKLGAFLGIPVGYGARATLPSIVWYGQTD